MEIDFFKLKELNLRLLKQVKDLKPRFFVKRLNPLKPPRLKILKGFRGVGKTTALLQLLSKHQGFYVSMDNPLVVNHDLYSIAEFLISKGYNLLLFDEVHTSLNWQQHAKAVHDAFPNVKLVLSGSAPLAFNLDRRFEIIDIEPLSFREFLYLKNIDVPVSNHWLSVDQAIEFLSSYNLQSEFDKYMQGGAIPTFFELGESNLKSIYNSIWKSIHQDAVFFSRVNGATIIAMERALNILASSELGEFSIFKMSKHLGVSKYKAYEIFQLLQDMKILRLVKPYGKGPKLERGEPKILFYHPCFRQAISSVLGVKPSLGALREELAVFNFTLRGWNVFTVKGFKKNPDYVVSKQKQLLVVEIGGFSKSFKQLKGFKNKVLLTPYQLITLSLF